MASANGRVILFLLLDYSEPKFVGLAWEKEFNKTIQEHRRTKPPFMVQVLGAFDSLYAAQAAARPLIQRYHTQLFGYNKTDYGDLDNKPLVNPGGYKWNNGTDSRQLPQYDEWRKGKAEFMSEYARLNNYKSRLPYHAGETHPMKREESRDKLRNTSNGRKRYYFDDGSWTWVYSKNSPLAFKNRENGIPCLEEVPPDRLRKRV